MGRRMRRIRHEDSGACQRRMVDPTIDAIVATKIKEALSKAFPASVIAVLCAAAFFLSPTKPRYPTHMTRHPPRVAITKGRPSNVTTHDPSIRSAQHPTLSNVTHDQSVTQAPHASTCWRAGDRGCPASEEARKRIVTDVSSLLLPSHFSSSQQDPEAVSALRRLSSKLLQNSFTRHRLAALPASQVSLGQCGSLLAPFNGSGLLGLEKHLTSHGNPFNSNQSRLIHQRLSARHLHANISTGFSHAAIPLVQGDGLPPAADSAEEPLLLRTRVVSSAAQLSWRYKCFHYRHAVFNAYIGWMLGELDVAPRMAAVWLDWSSLESTFVAARWQPIEGPVAHTIPASLAGRLLEQMRLVADAGLLMLDLKLRDMLVRQHAGGWDARLTDIEITPHLSSPCKTPKPDVCRANITSLAGVLPGVTSKCRLLLSLQLPTTLFACGPLRHTALARSFTRLFLELVDGGDHASAPVVTGWAAHVQESCHLEPGLDAGFAPLADTGLMPATYAWKMFVEKTILDNQRRVTMHSLMEQMLGNRKVDRDRGRLLVCPSKATWDRTFTGVLG